MHEGLQKEIQAYEKRTPKSREAHAKAAKRIPLGVASNYRAYDPYPLFVKDGKGGHIRDVDGNEYVDFNLSFGALIAGHCHPAVIKAVQEKLNTGTMFGMPHDAENALAEEICARFPVDMVRFSNSGTESTMHAVRLARAATGRDRIVKMEGGYHGLHDSALVSVKPKANEVGDGNYPNSVPGGEGVTKATLANTVVAQFNDLAGVERLFAKYPGEIAAVIVEPIMMNVGILMPDAGYHQGLREITKKNGALLIFDEVKTGAKLARGGACEFFNVKPDLVCLAKSIGGGFSLAAFGATRDIMNLITDHRVFHGGTYNTNPVAMAAGLATFREVLTPAAYEHVTRLNKKLLDGYQKQLDKTGLTAYVVGAGSNGALMFFPKPIRNYRDWLAADTDLWRHYWFAMTNRGVIPQPYWWDEQWTISVAHTEADIEKHLECFAEVAPALAAAQRERAAAVAR
ncbi:MAG TPA: glutamate-1-semialdehyde 2,1-aminomutase [Candidatus Acidoferrales bacterium]|nr:glutamate-1-semialdehyde 2,1-aminomutase [Candidatus Acidoferrales bacterium]